MIREFQIKMKHDIASFPRRVIIKTSIGEDVLLVPHLYSPCSVDGNKKWCIHCGRERGRSFKMKTKMNDLIQHSFSEYVVKCISESRVSRRYLHANVHSVIYNNKNVKATWYLS